MASSSTTFSERIARIQTRADIGEVGGYVTPGVVDETSPKSAHGTARTRTRKSRGGYLGSLVGGLFASVSIMAVGVAVMASDVKATTFEDLAASLLVSDK